MFQWLQLAWQTKSGIRLSVERYGDWNVYNEVFVNGDYDEAIALALDHWPGDRLQILDVGANVGYFTLRVFDQLLLRGMPRESAAVTAIEADPGFAAEYGRRVLGTNGFASSVRLIKGLAGRRSGMGALLVDAASADGDADLAQLPYLDLMPILTSAGRIDLLKCDIEGAEEDFIESYPELFEKTRVAVFEFHGRLCNVERCRTLLREYGFSRTTMRRPETDYPLCTLWR